MDRVALKFDVARRALHTLLDALALPESDIVRDASIQRFEYTFEATWKYAQAALHHVEHLDAASPRTVIRACWERGMVDEATGRALLGALDDRNQSVHTYNEPLAREIFDRLCHHADQLRAWQDGVTTWIESEGA